MGNSGIKTKSDRIYQVLIYLILGVLAALAILPFILLLSSSFSEETALMNKGYSFIPRNFTTYAYEYLVKSNGLKVIRAYGITILATITGTCIHLLIAPMLGWVLSRKDYKRAGILTFLVFFTMLFNGGVVPSYIMYTQVFHIKNTFWALVIPTLVMNGFHIMLYKNYFSSNIHPALVEAARIDGAGELHIYCRIVLPLSLPILATIGLMIAIGYWNDWVNGLYYVTNTDLYSLQQYLKSIIDNINTLSSLPTTGDVAAQIAKMPSISIRMAIAVVGVVPIMILYPFFQKAFVAGIALGGVKE